MPSSFFSQEFVMKLRLSKEWFERQAKKEEGEVGAGRMSGKISSNNVLRCGVCYGSFDADYPSTGESVTCPHCEAEGYGTYSENLYSIEWYEK